MKQEEESAAAHPERSRGARRLGAPDRSRGTRILRLTRRLSVELALLALGAACAAKLGASVWALAAGAWTLAACAAGVAVLHRRGELRLAWDCPRLDRLQLRVESNDLPWAALRSADSVLEALDAGGARRAGFYVGAKSELLKAASRVVDAHRLSARARAALIGAPEGEGRRRLEHQAQRADAELLSLTTLLRELRARMLAASAPVASVEDPTASLEALARRTDALSQAVEELDTTSSHRGALRA